MQGHYSPDASRQQDAGALPGWGSYSIYLEPHKLRWILRWLEKQPTPRDMDDASDIRGPNGELKDYVEALHYVESVSSSEGDLAGDDATMGSIGHRSHGKASTQVQSVLPEGASKGATSATSVDGRPARASSQSRQLLAT